MNKILLDFGANKGQGLSKMIELYQIDKTWFIESFEPNPLLCNFLKNNFKKFNLNINFIEAAVWNEDKEIEFSIMNENDEGSSAECLISEGRASDPNDTCYRKHNNIIKTRAIDILTILNKYKDNDFIIIKMDIEGSEFNVLRRLLENPIHFKKIKKIYIEWHTGYLKLENENTQKNIIDELKKYGIETINWY
jgi:FkbM family methyltransferase